MQFRENEHCTCWKLKSASASWSYKLKFFLFFVLFFFPFFLKLVTKKPGFRQQWQLKPIFLRKKCTFQILFIFWNVCPYFTSFILFYFMFFFFLIFHQMRSVRWKKSPSNSLRNPWKQKEHPSITSLCLLAIQVCYCLINYITQQSKVSLI